MTKTITIGLVAIAFVAGSILTGTMAYAGDDDDDGGNAIVDALNQIAIAIQGIDPTVNVDPTPVNVNVDPTPVTINAPQGDKGDQGDTGPAGPAGQADPVGIFVAQVASDGTVYGRGTPNIMVDARGNGNYVVTFTDFPTSGLSSGLCNAVASATLGSGQPGDEGSLIDTDFSVIAAAFHLGGGNVNVITMDIPGGPTVNKNFNVILACSSP